jgi:hypothetical protein
MRNRRSSVGFALRVALALIVAVAVMLVAGSWAPAPAQGVSLFRASASAAAVHGFYDHRNLFPVPILDLSAPYAEATFEPGSASSLGSFLWEPEAAELGTIFCQLSNGQFCQFPDYPFQARATYPSSEQQEPPKISIHETGAPVGLDGAAETASASATSTGASATLATFQAIPMSGPQAAAARSLAVALTSAAQANPAHGLPLGATAGARGEGSPPEPSPWLLAMAHGSASSAIESGSDGISSSSTSQIEGLQLLGGMITIDVVKGETSAAMGSTATGSAAAKVVGVRVGDLAASIDSDGIQIADERLGGTQLKQLQAILNGALSQAGLSISAGLHEVTKTSDGLTAIAYAFSIDVEREVIPGQAPDGIQGTDVLQVPFGLAASSASRADQLGVAPIPGVPPPVPPAAPPPDTTLQPAPGSIGVGNTALAAPAAEPASRHPSTITLFHVIDLGVPALMAGAAVLIALGLVLVLNWLKVLEVLVE